MKFLKHGYELIQNEKRTQTTSSDGSQTAIHIGFTDKNCYQTIVIEVNSDLCKLLELPKSPVKSQNHETSKLLYLCDKLVWHIKLNLSQLTMLAALVWPCSEKILISYFLYCACKTH